jgi:lysophospholipase L1-like esterase
VGRVANLRVGLVLAVALPGLALAEWIARRTSATGFASLVDPLEHHPLRPYARVRDARGELEVVTNSLGWKDSTPRLVPRQPTGRRVVILGDSFVEGLGLAGEVTIPAKLEAILRSADRGVEVLNGGRVSYSPLVEYQRLRRFFAAGYRTDLIVVMPDLSDPQDELHYAGEYLVDADGSPTRLKSANAGRFSRWLYNHSAALRAGWRLQRRWTGRLPGEIAHSPGPFTLDRETLRLLSECTTLDRGAYAALPAEARAILRANWIDHRPSRAGWANEGLTQLEENLDRLASLAARHDSAVLLALYPWPQSLYTSAEDLPRLQEAFPRWFAERAQIVGDQPGDGALAWRILLQRWAARHGVEIFDSWPLFLGDEWTVYYLRGDVHFNERGAEFVARALAPEVTRLLDSRSAEGLPTS